MKRAGGHFESHIVDVSDRVRVIAYPSLDVGIVINLRRYGSKPIATEVRLSELERELRKRVRQP